nr:YadA-like family protein [uncultured Aggregatibacter sp.]
MNHIYKSIFNKALGVFTAVPEFASAHGKGSERTVVGRVAKGTAGFAASALAISVGLALTSTSAVAAPGIFINNGQDPACLAVIDDVATSALQLIYGVSKTIYPAVGVAAGSPLGTKTNFELDARNPCLSTGGTGAENHNTQTNRTLFYNNKNLTLGGRLDVNSGIIGVGNRGVNGTDATNSIRMGTGTTLDDTNKHTNAIAIGVDTATTAEGAVAISAEAKARTSYSIAIGRNATAGGDMVPPSNETGGAIAIGRNSLSNYIGAIALGNGAEVSSAKPDGKTTDGIAIGTKALVDNYRGMAIGAQSQAKGSQSIVLANNAPDAKVSVASGIRSQVYGVESEASGTDAVAIGYKNTVAAHRTYAIGNDINVAKEAEEALAFGTRAHVSGAYQISLGSDAGADAVAANTSGIAIGRNAGRYGQSGILNTAIGAASGQYVSGSYNIAMGTGAGSGTDAEKLAASQTISIGHNAKASKHTAIAMGTTAQARTEKSVALGENAIAGDTAAPTVKKGEYSTAIGSSTSALGYGATAVGSITKAKVNYATALGHEAEASGSGETSLGYGAGANSTSPNGNRNGVNVGTNAGRYAISGGNNVAVGISAGQYVEGNNNIAQGYSAGYYIKGNENVSIGTNANVGSATDKLEVSKTVAIGSDAKTSANNAIAMGNTAQAKTTHSIAIGQNASAGDDSANAEQKGVSAVAIGHGAQANYYDAIAIGARATVAPAAGNTTAADSIAIGVEATADNYKTTAIGTYARAKGKQSTVIANNIQGSNYSTASGDRSQVYGVETTVSGNNSVAIGDTNNVASLRTYAMGNNISVSANASDSLALGSAVKVDGDSAIALGKNSAAAGNNQISIGVNAARNTTGGDNHASVYSVSIGTNAGADNASTAKDGNTEGVAIGYNAGRYVGTGIHNSAIGLNSGMYIQGSDNIAFGSNAGSGKKDAVLDINRTVAIGANALASKNNAVSIGGNSKAQDISSVAIGDTATAANANSVALGARSTTADVHTGDYTLNNSYTAAGLPVAANGTVSVGAAGKERQIQNVAAGVISATSTDAINGSQLYATNNYLSNLAGGVKNVLGGDAAVDNAGNVTMSNIGGTGKGNVNDAIAAANTKVAAGNNITVTPTTNADGSKTYTVATTKDLVVDSVKAGDTTVNKDGVTIAGGPSVKKDGINAGDKKITGVADGNVAAGSTDAVNGGQLAEVKAKADSAVQNVVSANPTALTATKAGDTVTLTPNFIAGDLVNTDGTVKDPAAADEGKLVSAKTVADALKANHFVVDTKANGGKVDAASEENAKVGSGNKVTFEAGKNLVAQQTNTANGGATVNYKLSDTLENLVSVKSAEIEAGIGPNKVVLNNNGVKVGDSTLNDKGLTINNGPSVTDTGIDAGNKKITGVADGNVAAGSTDAVNGGQLAAVKAKADTAVQDIKSGDEKALSVTKAGNTYTITPNLSGDLVDANGNITAPTTPADKGKLVTAGTVAEALANTHFVVDTKATDGELDAASQADQKIKASNKVTLQAGKNLKAKQTNGANGAEVEFSLKDSISLKEVKVGEGSANEVVLNDKGVNVAGNTYINKDGLNANGNKVANVKAGDVSATSTDAVNGAQLHNVATSVANVLGGNAAVDGNGNVTSSDIGGTGKGTVHDAIAAVNATAAKHTTVVEGKNVKVTKGKNAAGGDEYTVATKDDLDVTSVTAGNTTVNTNGLTITGGPSVTRGGIDAGNRIISGVKAGDVSATSQEAVNGSQLHATNTKLDGVKAKADTAVQDVKSGDENALTAVKDPNTNIVTVTPKLSGNLVDADGNITAPATDADKGKLVTAGTVAQALANTHFVVDTKATDGELDGASEADQKIKAGNKVTLQAGKNLKAKQTNGANGAQVEFSLKDSISLTEVTAGTGDNQVVLGNNGVQVGGNTYINKDGLNANSKVISNVADGVNPNDAVNKGQLDAVKGVADSAVKSVDVANGEQNLVVDNTDPKNPKLSLKKDLTVDSVKAGDSTLNTDGLTIAGGPSVKKDGIDAGDKKIANVAAGDVSATSKDAVNGGQLYNVANNVKDLIGPDATIDPATGKVTVADPAKGIGETGKGNIGDAIKHVNDAAKAAADTAKKHTTVEQGDNIVVEESTNANGGKHYKVSTARDLNVDSVKAGDTTVNNDGVTIAGGPSVTKAGINAGGNTITNVADGVNPNDAVNKGQLDAVKGVADSAVKSVKAADGEQNLVVDNSDPKNPKLSLKKDLTVDSVKAGDSTLNTDGLTIAGGPSVKKDGIDAGDKKITNVAAGDVAENSKDAVNGGQLHNVAKGVADVLGGDAAVDGDGKVTMTNIGETGKGNVNDAIKHVNDLAKNAADTAKKHTTVEQGDNIVVEESTNANGGKHYKVSTARDLNVDSVKAGDTTVNNDGVTINNGPSMTKDGINANNTKVTNVADGVDAADAVNKGQLDKVDTKVSNVAQNVVNVLGGDATVNGNGDITMSNIGETGKGNINDAIKSVNDLAKKAAAEKTSVKAKEGRSNVTVTEGVNAAGGHEYTVDVERSVTNAGSDYVTVTNNHDADSNTTTYTVDVSAKTKASLAKADSAVQGLTSKDGNLNFTKGANGNVEVSFNDNLNVKNITTDRVQVANGPSMSKDGINAAGKAISNVANGNVAADSKDAVNGGQLHETAKSVADVIGGGATVKDGKVVAGQNGIGNTGQNTVHGAIAAINQNTANNFNQIRGDLRKMDRDLRGGIAGALATAGLPQAFRPGKSMVAAAASTYRGQSGLAIGVSRISDNGKVILKVTGNTNSRGDFGGTIGAGYQW